MAVIASIRNTVNNWFSSDDGQAFFDSYVKYNNQPAWPFWYPFIPFPYLDTDSENGGLGLLGFTLNAGEIKDIPIITEQDTAYRLINIKYSIYRDCAGARIGTNALFGITEGTTALGVTAGTGDFTTDLIEGSPLYWVNDDDEIQTAIVVTITDDDNLVINKTTTGESTAQRLFFGQYCDTTGVCEQVLTAPTTLTGTITITTGSAAIVGVGTLFVAELTVGDMILFIADDGTQRIAQITVITDNLNATMNFLAANVDFPATGVTFSVRASNIGTGTLQSVNVTPNVIVGNVTTFLSDFVAGDLMFYATDAGTFAVCIDAVINDLIMTYTGPAETITAATDLYANGDGSAPVIQPPNLKVVTPMTKFLRATLIITSSVNKYLYGGSQSFISTDPGLIERRIQISAMQGIDDGAGIVRTPYLVPKESTILIRIENTYTGPITVNGNTFGYKLALAGGRG